MISALATSMEDAFGPLSRPGAAPKRADATPPASADAESSFDLVVRAREGDTQALEQLCARYFPRLQRWAHGRLPSGARGALDTNDLVQDTLMQVVRRLDTFEPRHDGAFQGYVRKTLFNRICDLARWHERRGPVELLATSHPAADPSPLEEAIGQEAFERYDAAMSRLRPDDRQAIIAKVEMALPYSEITVLLGKPSVAAAQMAVSRALVRLAKEMAVARGK
jgi:RNA polymerase sigma factor (sigma-70 family)